VTPSVERDVQVGFTYWAPAARIGVDRTFFDHLTLDVGYKVTYYDFNDISPSLIQDTPLGQDFQEKFLLESLEQRVTLDYRDNPLNPKQGLFARGVVQESGNYVIGGMFQFLKLTAGVEGYIPFELGTSWVLAARARAGSIYNLEAAGGETRTEDIQRVPTISRLYSGGKGSMRSFGQRQLSLYRATQRGSVVPVGGLSQVEMSIEPRFQLVENFWGVGDIWGAAFVDAASVHRGPLFSQTRANSRLGVEAVGIAEAASKLLYGAGVGFWWDTPIGPVRADFAYSLTPPRDERFRQCASSEAPETGDPSCPKKPLSEDLVQQRLSRFNFLIGIGHSF
jgi:translocation and assembly module TamA